MSGQVAEKEPASEAGGTPHDNPTADRLEDFSHQLASVTSLMTSAQRAENVVGLGLLGEALRRAHAAMTAGRACPPSLLQALGRCLDRLESPAARVLATTGRAQRSRYVELLALRAAEHGALVAAICRYVEPEMSAAAFRSSLADAVQTELMLDMCEKFDTSMARLTDLVTKQRSREELREQRFDEHLDSTAQSVTARLDAAEKQIDAQVGRATEEFDRFKNEMTEFRRDFKKVLEHNYLVALLHAHEQEEIRERTGSLKREIAGLVIASLALIPLTVLFYSPPQTSVLGWLSHLGPASLFLAVGTYCLRKAAHHRQQALELRTRRLGMDTAFRVVSDQLTDEQRRNLQQHLAGHGAAAQESESRVTEPEALSVLPLDRLPRLVASVAELVRKDQASGPAEAETDVRDRP